MLIKIDKFEGPLGLLLQLIQKEEMDIADVSLAKIADEYVNNIRNSSNIKPDDMADFLVVVAKLLLIKSKFLLPYLQKEEEEEIEEFERQLKMYKEFLDASQKIEKMLGKKKFMFSREFNRKAVLQNNNFFAPPKKLEKQEMKNIFKDLIERIKPFSEEKLEEKSLEKKVNIEEKILAIQNMLINKMKINFNKILKNAKSKTEVIVSFLAMLELVKQRDILANQEGLFKEIFINKI
ncbi:MAG: segregation/condensation protein A [Candidatus Falkowbacteria bacterium]